MGPTSGWECSATAFFILFAIAVSDISRRLYNIQRSAKAIQEDLHNLVILETSRLSHEAPPPPIASRAQAQPAQPHR